MNYKMLRYITGQLLIAEALLMLPSLIVSFVYGELGNINAFIIPMISLLVIGLLFSVKKPENKTLRVKDGFVIVGLSWIVMSVFGCLPFIISGLIPNFVDAFFETVSGFTTTGSSVLLASDFDKLWSPVSAELGMRGVFFWRSFTNWIGGMGVLVFVLAVMPQQDMKSSRLVHVMRAEMPGPKVDKIVATVKRTAAIMYAIYVVMTVAELILLLFGGMDFYEALCTAASTAGTGGFSIWPDSMVSLGGVAHLEYCTWVIATFMFLFSINFNLYFLIITGRVAAALFSEELRWFVGIVLSSTAIITVNLYSVYGNVSDALRHAFFQVGTVLSTCGFATDDFNLWPNISKVLLLVLMFVGACAGSTGGGIKISRLIIAVKGTWAEIRRMIRPREVRKVFFEKKAVESDTVKGTFAYLVAYCFIFFASFIIIALLDGCDVETSFSTITTCLNNIGPGLGDAGPMSNFAFFSPISKIVLSLDMLLGRLEIFPLIFLFSPSVWLEK